MLLLFSAISLQSVSQQVCWQQLHVKSHDEFKLVTILLLAILTLQAEITIRIKFRSDFDFKSNLYFEKYNEFP